MKMKKLLIKISFLVAAVGTPILLGQPSSYLAFAEIPSVSGNAVKDSETYHELDRLRSVASQPGEDLVEKLKNNQCAGLFEKYFGSTLEIEKNGIKDGTIQTAFYKFSDAVSDYYGSITDFENQVKEMKNPKPKEEVTVIECSVPGSYGNYGKSNTQGTSVNKTTIYGGPSSYSTPSFTQEKTSSIYGGPSSYSTPSFTQEKAPSIYGGPSSYSTPSFTQEKTPSTYGGSGATVTSSKLNPFAAGAQNNKTLQNINSVITQQTGQVSPISGGSSATVTSSKLNPLAVKAQNNSTLQQINSMNTQQTVKMPSVKMPSNVDKAYGVSANPEWFEFNGKSYDLHSKDLLAFSPPLKDPDQSPLWIRDERTGVVIYTRDKGAGSSVSQSQEKQQVSKDSVTKCIMDYLRSTNGMGGISGAQEVVRSRLGESASDLVWSCWDNAKAGWEKYGGSSSLSSSSLSTSSSSLSSSSSMNQGQSITQVGPMNQGQSITQVGSMKRAPSVNRDKLISGMVQSYREMLLDIVEKDDYRDENGNIKSGILADLRGTIAGFAREIISSKGINPNEEDVKYIAEGVLKKIGAFEKRIVNNSQYNILGGRSSTEVKSQKGQGSKSKKQTSSLRENLKEGLRKDVKDFLLQAAEEGQSEEVVIGAAAEFFNCSFGFVRECWEEVKRENPSIGSSSLRGDTYKTIVVQNGSQNGPVEVKVESTQPAESAQDVKELMSLIKGLYKEGYSISDIYSLIMEDTSVSEEVLRSCLDLVEKEEESKKKKELLKTVAKESKIGKIKQLAASGKGRLKLDELTEEDLQSLADRSKTTDDLDKNSKLSKLGKKMKEELIEAMEEEGAVAKISGLDEGDEITINGIKLIVAADGSLISENGEKAIEEDGKIFIESKDGDRRSFSKKAFEKAAKKKSLANTVTAVEYVNEDGRKITLYKVKNLKNYPEGKRCKITLEDGTKVEFWIDHQEGYLWYSIGDAEDRVEYNKKTKMIVIYDEEGNAIEIDAVDRVLHKLRGKEIRLKSQEEKIADFKEAISSKPSKNKKKTLKVEEEEGDEDGSDSKKAADSSDNVVDGQSVFDKNIKISADQLEGIASILRDKFGDIIDFDLSELDFARSENDDPEERVGHLNYAAEGLVEKVSGLDIDSEKKEVITNAINGVVSLFDPDSDVEGSITPTVIGVIRDFLNGDSAKLDSETAKLSEKETKTMEKRGELMKVSVDEYIKRVSDLYD